MFNADELNQQRIWNDYADCGYLQSTIDPRDVKGLKCDYINRWSRYYMRKLVLGKRKRLSVLEIGCGSGRNLLQLAKYIRHGYGVDVAEKQIRNAEYMRERKTVQNISFLFSGNSFPRLLSVDVVFTMWVLQHFESDDNLCSMVQSYMKILPETKYFVFFEQISLNPCRLNENGAFYKKVRTYDDYVGIFQKVSLALKEFKVINEKGFGPLYSKIYSTGLYNYWPKWLNINLIIFPLDRILVNRTIRSTFTDCVFICERDGHA